MLFLLAYISSVVLINFAFSAAPHLDIIWSAWGGLVFILRDMVQTLSLIHISEPTRPY